MAGNDFVKGRTNNHLTFAMVDATDFATPESALSAAMKLKIWGKLRGATGVNFVSSGTGSLTNDIQHVGPSVLGVYTIALVKADLSDASAAWYDQYEISASATGAAYQFLVVDGGIDASALLQASSRVLVNQSYLSDIRSHLSDLQSDFQSRVPKRVATDSQLSNLISGVQSADLSDIASAVALELASQLSDIFSAAQQANSRVLVAQSFLSDIRSHVSDLQSDFQSRVPKLVATSSQLSDLESDVKSAVAVGNSRVLLVQSMGSDLQSKLSDLESNLLSFLTTTGVTINASSLSDIRSAIAGVTVNLTASDISDIASAVLAGAGATVLSASDMSDIASRVWAVAEALALNSRVVVAQSYLSDIRSHVSDLQSDFQSRVPKAVATASKLSDVESNLLSFLVSPGVQLNPSSMSDLRSAITAGATGLDASALSDIASAVVAAIAAQGVALDASTLSDIRSAITAGGGGGATASDIASHLWITHATGAAVASRVLQIRNQVSDLQSDFQSRVPKRVATDSQLSDLHSDLKSHLAVSSGVQSDIYSLITVVESMASDAASAAQQVNSRVLLAQSVLSDVQSAIGVIPAAKLAQHAAAVLAVVVGAGSTTTAVKLSTVEGGAPSAVNDFYNDRVIIFTSGALAGQATSISDYDGATTTATVVALTAGPANLVTAVIV